MTPQPLPTVNENPESCKTCRFWAVGYYDGDPQYPEEDHYDHTALGACRRYPKAEPKFYDDWCGEWQAKRAVPRADAKVIYYGFLKSLPPRANNVLVYAGVRSLEQLTAMTLQDVLMLRNCGEVTAAQIKAALASYGLSLRAD